MGFVKRDLGLEAYLDSIGVKWTFLTDQEYKRVLSRLDAFIEAEEYWSLVGDEAFRQLSTHLPLTGYVFSAPRHKLFSVYESGGDNKTMGYAVDNLSRLDRETLNRMECVVTNRELAFACAFNHEWQAMCPELYIGKNA